MAQRIARGRQKRRARINIFPVLHCIITLILAVALIVVAVDRAKLQDRVEQLTSAVQTGGDQTPGTSSEEGTSSQGPTASQQWAMNEVNQWYLKLVNYENALPSDFNIETELINTEYARSHHRFDVRAMDALKNLCVAAKNDGVDLFIISPYRTYNTQASLYQAEVQEWLDKGYAKAAAEEKAATIVARPGTSEHNLGLAVDFNSVEENFDQTATYRWLKSHAADYGFIMRYAKEKQDITKVIYEPWHYRYVGVEHAKAINDLGYCLEEYVEYLKNGGAAQ